MNDFTTIQPYPVLPELAVLQNENTVLTKSNKTLKWILGGLAFIGLVGSIYNKIQKGSLRLSSAASQSKNEKESDLINIGM